MEAETLDKIADQADYFASNHLLDKHASAAEICELVNVALELNIHFNSTAGRYAEACFRRRIRFDENIAELERQFVEVPVNTVVDRCSDYGERAA